MSNVRHPKVRPEHLCRLAALMQEGRQALNGTSMHRRGRDGVSVGLWLQVRHGQAPV